MKPTLQEIINAQEEEKQLRIASCQICFNNEKQLYDCAECRNVFCINCMNFRYIICSDDEIIEDEDSIVDTYTCGLTLEEHLTPELICEECVD